MLYNNIGYFQGPLLFTTCDQTKVTPVPPKTGTSLLPPQEPLVNTWRKGKWEKPHKNDFANSDTLHLY